jgi:hypothetical protein
MSIATRSLPSSPVTLFGGRRTLLAAATALFAASCSRPPEQVDLILLAGQSNAVGYDSDPARLPPDDSDARVMFWWRCGESPPDHFDSTSAGQWTGLQVQPNGKSITAAGNFRLPAGGFGPEFGIARALASEERKLAIVKTAWNGTSVAVEWSSDGGVGFRSLLDELRLAKESARTMGVVLRPRALVWLQGESDAVAERDREYEQALSQLLTKLREVLGTPALPLLLGVNVHYGDVERIRPRIETIVNAQKAVAARLGNAAYVDTQGVSLANNAHFDSEGTLEAGRRFAAALLRLEHAAAAQERP